MNLVACGLWQRAAHARSRNGILQGVAQASIRLLLTCLQAAKLTWSR